MEDAEAPRRLLNDIDLDLVSDQERQAYYMLSDREYAHTREYSPELLKKIGMDTEFHTIWKAVGWTRFAVKEIEDGISFRFFREEFTLTWKGLSTLLGFHNCRKIDLQKEISGFEKNRFWEDISGAPICKKPRTIDIHNPTLRLMYKWIAMTLFPRGDLRPIRGDELIIMFAMSIEESRAGGAYREMRNMTRNERENSSSSTPVQMYEAGWEPTGMHLDGPKLHVTASESQPGQVPMGEIQYNLSEHIAQTQEWQQSADAQFANFNNMMQQQHDDLQAYFRFQGFNPYQGP
uniref:Uncharacterized protein n=1 Tax=Oryza sativa subsp. japonica TaxID=39947 RepID=Q2QUT8_ORYSJ|nr:hypothetical protein LOC_Os12g15130 [Oryza sativa Japonica Group]